MVWSPDELNDKELELLLYALKKYGNESTSLYGKFWCWKMNYRNKNHGLS